jgi:hypothetical protein
MNRGIKNNLKFMNGKPIENTEILNFAEAYSPLERG